MHRNFVLEIIYRGCCICLNLIESMKCIQILSFWCLSMTKMKSSLVLMSSKQYKNPKIYLTFYFLASSDNLYRSSNFIPVLFRHFQRWLMRQCSMHGTWGWRQCSLTTHCLGLLMPAQYWPTNCSSSPLLTVAMLYVCHIQGQLFLFLPRGG